MNCNFPHLSDNRVGIDQLLDSSPYLRSDSNYPKSSEPLRLFRSLQNIPGRLESSSRRILVSSGDNSESVTGYILFSDRSSLSFVPVVEICASQRSDASIFPQQQPAASRSVNSSRFAGKSPRSLPLLTDDRPTDCSIFHISRPLTLPTRRVDSTPRLMRIDVNSLFRVPR